MSLSLAASLQWCPDPGLNWRPHPYQGCALPTELPGLKKYLFLCLFNNKAFTSTTKKLSGKWDSNPRHSAWKADALPTELLPQYVLPQLQICHLSACHFHDTTSLEGVGFEPTKALCRQIYSLLPLASRASLLIQLLLNTTPSPPSNLPWPAAGLEPATY